jgi:hypothetical protein
MLHKNNTKILKKYQILVGPKPKPAYNNYINKQNGA